MHLKIFSNKIFIIFLFVLAILLIFWPILFGDKTINDFFGLDLAHYKFLSDFGESVKESYLKLWWPNYLGGFPVFLTQVGFFSPLGFVLYKFLSGFAIYNWLTFFNFVLAGLAMYWLARNLSLSKTASAISGLAYMLSQNHLYWGATLPFSNVYPFIPLFFLSLLKISQGRKWWLLFGGLISAYGLAAGETQIVFYTFAVGFFWSLFLTYFRNSNYGSNNAAKFRPVLGYVAFVVGGAILASFWLLPVLNYLGLTTRGAALSFGDLAYDFMRIADPLRFFYPYIQLPQFTGLASLGIVPNYYIGVLALLLAVAAIFLVRKNKTIAFWTGVAAFSFLIRIKWTGIFWILHFLPGFDRFRGVFHWSFIGSFALALLAGFGLNNLEKIKESRYFKRFISGLKIFVWANIILVAIIFLTSLFRARILNKIFQFFDAKIYSETRQFPLEHYHNVITSEFDKFLNAFSLSNYHFLISFLSILTAVLIFILYQKGKINFDNFKKIALAFVFFNLIIIWQGYYSFIPQSKIIEYPDTVSFIKSYYPKNKQYRFFRFYPPESYQVFEVFDIKDWTDYKLKTLESNIGVYFDMDTFGGVEPFMSARIANVFDEIGFERPTTVSGEPWLRSTKLSLNDKISRFSSSQNQNLLSMLNIKFIFSSFKFPLLRQGYEGQANLKLIYQTTATEKNIPVYVYENAEAMPRIYFANNVKYVDSTSAFEELLRIKDFHELTLVECEKDCPESELKTQSKFIIEEFQSLLVKIKTSGSGWLVYSDANLPTWEAYVDNQQTPIYTANYLFKSVFVPEGEHEIIFKYPSLWGQDMAALKRLIFHY
ncbi:MAG: hypothetical protein NTV77_03210 [Candidatus Azambacteria bacterium]|nr:hypothetical protein [Candidatus Azambacteria bacterium]